MEQRMKELNCVDVTPPDSPLTDDHVKSKRFLAKPESLDSLAYSDSELSWKNEYTDANSNNTKVSRISTRSNQKSYYKKKKKKTIVFTSGSCTILFYFQPLLEFIAFDGTANFSSPNGSQDSRTYKNKGTTR